MSFRCAAWLLAAGALWACSEAAEQAPDQAPAADADALADQGPADGGTLPDRSIAGDAGVEGQACARDADCEGVCVAQAGGARCATPCQDDMSCGLGRICGLIAERQVCVPEAARVPLGGACDGPEVRCDAGGRCVADGLDGARCRAPCDADSDCLEASRCAQPEGVCLPIDADAFSCATLGCWDSGLRCVRLAEGAPLRCLAPCFDAGAPCPDGSACRPPLAAEGRVCEGAAAEPGAPCGAGGRCVDGGVCLARAPGDPLARCAEVCEGGACAEGFTCRRPTGFEQPWCLAVPFGQGDGVGSQGEDCSAHGATDCRPELDCVAGVAGSRVCAAPCDMASCEPGLRCVPRRVDGAHCLPAGGDLGAACEGDDGCDGGTCLPAEDADLRFCTVACDGGCPADTVCDGGWCWPLPPAPEVGLGAPCGPEVVCAAGVCASDPGDGAARCAAPCGPDGACEPGFTCREVGGQGLCFPGD